MMMIQFIAVVLVFVAFVLFMISSGRIAKGDFSTRDEDIERLRNDLNRGVNRISVHSSFNDFIPVMEPVKQDTNKLGR